MGDEATGTSDGIAAPVVGLCKDESVNGACHAAGQYGKVDPGIEHFARLVERLAEAAEDAEARG